MNLTQQIESLRCMTVSQLKNEYVKVFGEECRSFHKDFLWKRIAWRIQALSEGDISEQARRHAKELACDADLRIQAPTGFLPPITPRPRTNMHDNPSKAFKQTRDPRIPMPGSELRRMFCGREILVLVEENGFLFEDKHYKSLTAVAKAASGSHWNGFDFFRLAKKGVKKEGSFR